MAVFIIRQHKQLPICEALVVNKVKQSAEWTLRYQLDGVAESITPIGLLDEKMGKATRAPGTYFAKFELVLEQWQSVLSEAPAAEPVPEDRSQKLLRRKSLAVFGLVMMGVMLRIMMVPIWLGLAILSGGSTSVIASIALADEWLSFSWLHKRLVTGRKTLSKGE